MQKTQEMQVQALGQEDPLQKDMATLSSVPAWKMRQTEELGGLQSTGVTKSRTQLSTHTHTKLRAEGSYEPR